MAQGTKKQGPNNKDDNKKNPGQGSGAPDRKPEGVHGGSNR
ncbi:MAG TPA: hypothetical protein VGH83_11165 [Candidatus Acidoferrum sp.]|jgi:hypothetical protein